MSETKSVYAAYSGNTYLFGGNAPYVEEMYENYLANPGSVPDTAPRWSKPAPTSKWVASARLCNS